MTTPWQSTGAVARCLWYLSSSHNIYKNILGLAKWVCGRRPGFAAVQRRCADSGICAGVLAHQEQTPATRGRRTYTHFVSPCQTAGAQRRHTNHAGLTREPGARCVERLLGPSASCVVGARCVARPRVGLLLPAALRVRFCFLPPALLALAALRVRGWARTDEAGTRSTVHAR